MQEKIVVAHEDVIQDGVTIMKRRENIVELQRDELEGYLGKQKNMVLINLLKTYNLPLNF